MEGILVRIKRAILSGYYFFSEKSRLEMQADRLTELDVAEAILNSVSIYKKLRSSSRYRSGQTEYLYVIQGSNFEGIPIYTKRKLIQEEGQDHYYFL